MAQPYGLDCLNLDRLLTGVPLHAFTMLYLGKLYQIFSTFFLLLLLSFSLTINLKFVLNLLKVFLEAGSE
jgi:hypothetical protein